MDLGYGHYHIPKFEVHSEPVWSWNWAKTKFYTKVFVAETADVRCRHFDKYVRTNYWYYLDGAKLVSNENSLFEPHCYCTHTYVNRIGLWQVIGTHGPNGDVVNTFVRLGDGCEEREIPTFKIATYPTISKWYF